MHPIIKWGFWLLVMLAFARFIGNTECAYESIQGGTHVFAYKPWVPVSALLGGIAFSIWIYKCPKSDCSAGNELDIGPYVVFAGIFVAVLLTMGFVYSVQTKVVEVDETGYVARTSFVDGGMADGEQNVQFADVDRIRMVSEQRWIRRRRGGGRWRTYYHLLFEQTSGTTTRMSVGNDVSRLAAAHILEIAIERGIPVSEPYAAGAEKWYAGR